jgi:uncharacterized protein
MARSTSVWLGGVWGLGAGGLLGWLLLGLGGLIGGAVLLGLTGLLLDHLLSSGYRFQSASQHHTGWGHTWGGFYGAGYQGRHGGDHRGGGHGGFGGGNSGGGGASRGF